MAPGLSAGGRLRSRTSDISDLLRGRHDPKTSTDSQLPPPVPPHQSEPAAAPKLKGKFSFLARKRKPSAVSPAPARAATDAAQRAKGKGKEGASPVPAVGAAPGGHLPTPRSNVAQTVWQRKAEGRTLARGRPVPVLDPHLYL
ncbi:hypothetical protein BC628DRAFT_175070 [Trametes gibbosa]|nr:hypothetical protein BC628DRAFT_175070 [Trametes gibbosa]